MNRTLGKLTWLLVPMACVVMALASFSDSFAEAVSSEMRGIDAMISLAVERSCFSGCIAAVVPSTHDPNENN